MRYHLAALLLVAVLPVMNVLAAPAPEPYAILDIGPPPKGETAEAYRKRQIEGCTFHATLCKWWCDPEVQKLSLIASMGDARPWLAKNIRAMPEDGDRRLRLTFRAGTRTEQVIIINALLRVTLFWQEEGRKFQEYCLRIHENDLLDHERHIKANRDPQETAYHQKEIDKLRSIQIPECRAKIARYKQYAVIKWAK